MIHSENHKESSVKVIRHCSFELQIFKATKFPMFKVNARFFSFQPFENIGYSFYTRILITSDKLHRYFSSPLCAPLKLFIIEVVFTVIADASCSSSYPRGSGYGRPGAGAVCAGEERPPETIHESGRSPGPPP